MFPEYLDMLTVFSWSLPLLS